MHFMSRVFSNTTSLMTSVCMRYVGAMAQFSIDLKTSTLAAKLLLCAFRQLMHAQGLNILEIK